MHELYIKEPGRIIVDKNGPIRSPIKINIEDHDIKKYKMKMKSLAIEDYEITKLEDYKQQNIMIRKIGKRGKVSIGKDDISMNLKIG